MPSLSEIQRHLGTAKVFDVPIQLSALSVRRRPCPSGCIERERCAVSQVKWRRENDNASDDRCRCRCCSDLLGLYHYRESWESSGDGGYSFTDSVTLKHRAAHSGIRIGPTAPMRPWIPGWRRAPESQRFPWRFERPPTPLFLSGSLVSHPTRFCSSEERQGPQGAHWGSLSQIGSSSCVSARSCPRDSVNQEPVTRIRGRSSADRSRAHPRNRPLIPSRRWTPDRSGGAHDASASPARCAGSNANPW